MPGSTPSRDRLADLTLTLLEVLGEISDDSSSVKNVHKLRTTVRRLEVAISQSHAHCSKKLERRLTSLRRRAGHVRDADVQLDMLDSLHNSASLRQVIDELAEWLRRRRKKYEAGLSAAVKKRSAGSRLRERLERLHKSAGDSGSTLASCAQAVQDVRKRYLSLSAAIPEGGDALHDFRKNCKVLRYTLEPIPDECAEQLVSRLKQVQDAIGEWHDWEELARHAEDRWKHRGLELLSVLRSRAKSARVAARRSAAELRQELLVVSKGRKPVRSVPAESSKSVAR
jgi:CHAD domain-containing protein